MTTYKVTAEHVAVRIIEGDIIMVDSGCLYIYDENRELVAIFKEWRFVQKFTKDEE